MLWGLLAKAQRRKGLRNSGTQRKGENEGGFGGFTQRRRDAKGFGGYTLRGNYPLLIANCSLLIVHCLHSISL